MANMTATTVRRFMGCPFLPVTNEPARNYNVRGREYVPARALRSRPSQPRQRLRHAPACHSPTPRGVRMPRRFNSAAMARRLRAPVREHPRQIAARHRPVESSQRRGTSEDRIDSGEKGRGKTQGTFMRGKRVQFDDETWNALDLLARDRIVAKCD
jgi:hypothetical protein